MQLRKEKGLCYLCDDKFSFTHKCPNKRYLLLQLGEDDDQTNVEPEPPDGTVPSPTNSESDPLHLSFNALKGANGALRFQGSIQGHNIQILLDGGSSNSFLQPRIAQLLKLPVEPVTQFQVLVGNGNTLTTEGFIKNLQVQIQGHSLQLLVYLLPITGAELVLEANWLATLGPHMADYSALLIKFYKGDSFVTLHGESKLSSPTPAQFHHLKRLHHTNSIAELFALQFHSILNSTDAFPQVPADVHPDLKLLLSTYMDIFATPSGLPPNRLQDHAIPQLEGSNPIKVKPYRYPFSQKAQIEGMVQEMLTQGITQPSTSPFSSPVILVKKKDGTWRFCTDYRALNTITVKDSFLFPTVDELLDELFGATHFSKLDLRSGYHQILVKPEDRHKTAFRTHQGLYVWLVMPFGLTNASATFQSLMNQVFKD